MTQRINISVPDSLFERLQDYKFDINISQLCQKAIEKEITKREDFERRINEPPELNEIIDRLRKEKMEIRQPVEELGIKDGIEWAKIAHYEEIQEALFEINYESNSEFINSSVDILPGRIHDYLMKKSGLDKVKVELPDDLLGHEDDISRLGEYLEKMIPNFNFPSGVGSEVHDIYYSSFKEGIVKFWDAVEDKI